MRFKHRSTSPLKKKARRGFRGYPVATVAYYGPDDSSATKVAVGIVKEEGAAPAVMRRWFGKEQDLRTDATVRAKILRFIEEEGAKSIAMADGILGCPHEEGVDYPDGELCPQCPFWAYRDRWSSKPS